MRWLIALHVIFMVTWFAGLFYLPRLFVYHAMADDMVGIERFKIMERKLFYGIMTPGGLFTIIFGLWALSYNLEGYLHMGWMHAKLSIVGLLILYHLYCGKLLLDFKYDRNKHSHVYYRVLNEIPVLFLVGAVILVIVQPF